MSRIPAQAFPSPPLLEPPREQGYQPGEGERRNVRSIQRQGKLTPGKTERRVPGYPQGRGQMRTGGNRPRQTRKEQVKVPSSTQTLRRGERIPASPSLLPPTPPTSWDFLLQARKLRSDPHLILQGPRAPCCLQLTSTPDPSGTLSLSCRAQQAPPCPPRSSFMSGHTAEYNAAMKRNEVLTPAPMGRTLMALREDRQTEEVTRCIIPFL